MKQFMAKKRSKAFVINDIIPVVFQFHKRRLTREFSALTMARNGLYSKLSLQFHDKLCDFKQVVNLSVLQFLYL